MEFIPFKQTTDIQILNQIKMSLNTFQVLLAFLLVVSASAMNPFVTLQKRSKPFVAPESDVDTYWYDKRGGNGMCKDYF